MVIRTLGLGASYAPQSGHFYGAVEDLGFL